MSFTTSGLGLRMPKIPFLGSSKFFKMFQWRMLPSPPSFLTGDLFSQILYLPEMCQLNLICYILAVGLMMFSNVQVGMTFVILPLSLLFFLSHQNGSRALLGKLLCEVSAILYVHVAANVPLPSGEENTSLLQKAVLGDSGRLPCD